jgi:hypothetical protein
MAYTATLLKRSVHGDERVEHYLVTADAASGSVVTGLGYINALQVTNYSMTTTTAMRVKGNMTVGSAAANGTVFCSSVVASGDAFYLTVFGR